MNQELEAWINTRPETIQKIARAFPPGEYKISENAPYGYTCPGTIVELLAYNENGQVRVQVKPENVLPAAIEHAKSLRSNFTVPTVPVDAYIDPKYLVPII